jgi:hypothetical protein
METKIECAPCYTGCGLKGTTQETEMTENLPRDEGYEDALDEAIDEALDGDMRADDWRQLRKALARRRALLEDALNDAKDDDDRKKLEAELAQTDEHIAVLLEEENITRFVEDSVRFSSEVRRLQQG